MNMNKQLIRLTEDDLHNIVKDAVNRMLKEGEFEKWAAQQDKKRRMQPNINQSKHPSSANSIVNEVMYNGRSYHGNNADDWADLADKREIRQFNLDPNVGTKVGKMNAQDMLNHAKNGVDFSKLTIDDRIDRKGNVHKDMNNMAPEEWRQWTKNGAARLRNWGNYHATRSDYTPNQRKEFSQEDYQKARRWNDYRNRGFNSALQQWNS